MFFHLFLWLETARVIFISYSDKPYDFLTPQILLQNIFIEINFDSARRDEIIGGDTLLQNFLKTRPLIVLDLFST